MENIENTEQFLSYIKTPLSQTSLNVLYSANNIRFERCQLFSEFIEGLIINIVDTYMGDKLTSPSQRLEHFKWCWDKNIHNFDMEGIYFNDTKQVYDYFKRFMVDSFYDSSDKDNTNYSKDHLIKVWKYIFNYNTNKTRSDVDMFIEVYKMFEKTLQK